MSDKSGFGISAKLEVKTEVPSEASGRWMHAVADIASPITEWLGLQGDKVRIHRKVVVTKMLKKAEEEIAALDKPLHPVPLKVVVPLLEHASQEEPDDDSMIERWARLLVSSATSDAVSPRFVSLLSELNGRQAALLEDVHKACLSGEFVKQAEAMAPAIWCGENVDGNLEVDRHRPPQPGPAPRAILAARRAMMLAEKELRRKETQARTGGDHEEAVRHRLCCHRLADCRPRDRAH